MKKGKIRIGLVPMKQDKLDKDRSLEQKLRLRRALEAYEDQVEWVDIDDVSPEDRLSAAGVCYLMSEVDGIVKKFQQADVDGIFIQHTDFGSEFVSAKIAGAFKVPVLLWGNPEGEIRDDAYGLIRYTSVGMFATGKIIRRYNRPFDYIPACTPESEMFRRGIKNFIGVCSVVRAFQHLRIMQISTRPEHFWSVKYNEGDLLDKFGIEVYVKGFNELYNDVQRMAEREPDRLQPVIEDMRTRINYQSKDPEQLKTLAALQTVLADYFERYDLSAAAVNCWYVKDELRVQPCSTFGILTERYMPVACETDVKGAIGSVLLQEAALRTSSTFFSDVCCPHPTNPRAGLLWHCGNFPECLACQGCGKVVKDKPDENFPCLGVGCWELEKKEALTLARFDDDNGEYSLFVGKCKQTDGPNIPNGTYTWVDTGNWPKWESHLVQGPYVHHISGILDDVSPVLYSAAKYLPGVKLDLLGNTEEQIQNYLWCQD